MRAELLLVGAFAIGLLCLAVVVQRFWDGVSGYSTAKSDADAPVHFWKPHSQHSVDVLASARHREVIEALGKDSGGRSNIACVAALVPSGVGVQPFGKVVVMIFGRQVGELFPADARAFRKRLADHSMSGKVTICSASVSFAGGTGNQPFHYEIRLAIEPFQAA